MDTTYCLIVHSKEYIEHAVVFENKPDIRNLLTLIEEFKTDTEFEFSAPVDDLFIDLLQYDYALSIMPDEFKEILKEGKKLLYGSK
jgi:hypothetical protein